MERADLEHLLRDFPEVDQAILSSVLPVPSDIIHFLQRFGNHFVELTPLTRLPIQNCYKTPETLGQDRIAAVVGAMTLLPEQDLLVLDAGTALTLDLLTRDGRFMGGNISPGMRSRFRALHQFTGKLPLISEAEVWHEIGRSTEEAIRAGVLNGMILEMDGTIDALRKEFPHLKVLLTGGDAAFFERRLKNSIFVHSEITLIGLNRILRYNVEK